LDFARSIRDGTTAKAKDVSDFATPQSAIDFAVCEAERIDAPGAIQGYGALIALDRRTGRVTHVSRNADVGLGKTIDDIIGMDPQSLAATLGLTVDLQSACAAIRLVAEATPGRVQPIEVARDETATYLLSLGLGHLVLDRRPEPQEKSPEPPAAWLARLSHGFGNAGSNLFVLAQTAVERVREFVGFDRVMIYRFADDWVGEVIAEAAAADQTPYLGLHYPATDIPAQARRLYLDNRIREIVDTQSLAVPIDPPCAANSSAPVDLSTSLLRAISPYHLEYMANMGVRATLVASIIVDGALWGLMTCHHRAPRQVTADGRMALLAGTKEFSERVGQLLREAARARAENVDNEVVAIENLLTRSENCVHAFIEAAILGARAEGAMLSVGDNVIAVGRAPAVQVLPLLKQRLVAETGTETFAIDRLREHFVGVDLPLAGICGAAGIGVASDPPVLLIMFREEFNLSVSWGGDPGRAAEVDPLSGKLSPRRSFATWQQTVTDRSRPWEDDVLGFLNKLAASGLVGRFAPRLDADIRAQPENPVRPDAQTISVMNASMDGMTLGETSDSDGVMRTVAVNRALTKMFGLDPTEVRSAPLDDLLSRIGVREQLGSLPADSDLVAWSPGLGLRNISLHQRGMVDSLIEGDHRRQEMQIFEDVTQLRRSELALKIALRQAVAESNAKMELLARMSHEFRTPVTAVLGLSDLIAAEAFGPHTNPKYAEFGRKINAAGQHLFALVEQVLSVSQIDSGHRVLEETEFDWGELALECITWIAERSTETNPNIALRQPKGGVRIHADALAMRQIAVNLIGNAAKFTPPSGHVIVTVTRDAMDAPTLIVGDDGPGIPADQIADLFRPFRQAVNPNAGKGDGIGLGLSIVRGLVELHGGTVRLNSSVGVGTEAIVLLPRTRSRP
jgi:light-regulated signal transduction histidine kinase (bacteriophytochrome)